MSTVLPARRGAVTVCYSAGEKTGRASASR